MNPSRIRSQKIIRFENLWKFWADQEEILIFDDSRSSVLSDFKVQNHF